MQTQFLLSGGLILFQKNMAQVKNGASVRVGVCQTSFWGCGRLSAQWKTALIEEKDVGDGEKSVGLLEKDLGNRVEGVGVREKISAWEDDF